MSRKRKKTSGRPPSTPSGRVEPIVLDGSTTDTNFLYFGAEAPSETMRMVGEVASERDRDWFAANLGADYRVRWSLPGEFPTDDVESIRGKVDAKQGRFAVVVLQLAPGARRRIPTLFMDGAKTTEPIPAEVWGELYEVATAKDQEAAARDLARRFGT